MSGSKSQSELKAAGGDAKKAGGYIWKVISGLKAADRVHIKGDAEYPISTVRADDLYALISDADRPPDVAHAEFVALVAAMREAQRDYFRRRTPADLDRSKNLEREVDRAIREAKDDQPKLFD